MLPPLEIQSRRFIRIPTIPTSGGRDQSGRPNQRSRLLAQMWLKKCPKCRGDMMRNMVENLTQCLQCGRILTMQEEIAILGLPPPPPPKDWPLAPAKRGRPRKHA